MNKKIKKLWVSALRSGKYKQGKHRLCHGGPQGVKYCCLGVLCDLAVKNGKTLRRKAFEGNRTLNSCIMTWAELESTDPELGYKGGFGSLSSLNDNEGLSFKEIAKIIDENL